MDIFSSTFSSLENAIGYASQKQKVISDNIANVDTPNYKAKDVSFQNALSDAVNSQFTTKITDPRDFSFDTSAQPYAVTTQQNVDYNSNGNSVDIDKEMSDMATNQIYYNTLVSRMSDEFQTLQMVIKGGS
ncbi:flagellar basal body rod protein FlgB [Heyndrickxia acidicola]|uniref:Flagellar basal body rod protein FlgB n=1 Tax=Heyndrickxia acidicola TaxID=209389 RepID=A0ABU6MGA7_9BACI|nr:flagellar basal body rod protein FlgB [Heyndrickxia acidicola]MED1202080.1 flagellar basal body rod protein FlgB [Heyndrickxia acidicola]